MVQALRDMDAHEELLLDYGSASTRPAYQCLCSYGFVPDYGHSNGDDDSCAGWQLDEEETAEVYVDGRRYEVGPTSIPETMVAALSADEEITLTPEIAHRLKQRLSVAAYNLLLDPWMGAPIERVSRSGYDNFHSLTWDDGVDDDDDLDDDWESALDIWSSRLAAQLRFHQHRTLLACAQGLGEWAAYHESKDLWEQKSIL